MAQTGFCSLPNMRIPGRPDRPLTLDGKPLSMIVGSIYDNNFDAPDFKPATGVATVLHNWCPEALFALLDVENWFSFTWTLTLNQGAENESKIEIGRIRNQITMGTLGKDEHWKVMITFDISPLEDNPTGGAWIPSIKETMIEDKNVGNSAEIEKMGISFVKDLILNRRWLTGKNMRHEFFIESTTIGMDPWDDGMRMDPHWLYTSLDLAKCTTCKSAAESGKSLNRCGRCGTASYCSGSCQQRDWPVHKAVCTMSMEDRGKALYYTQHGGLAGWKGEKTTDEHTTVDTTPDSL
ncbi:hypothetical protein E6O75_ATG05493 [Venturia nashicola]|uniref:MYND-type domain-containing protein n=1 Tax=Venturia nashicola TaxID=86259 RepID=A0A4Z1P327_9PEZI|nr:hypothetical protein E6O75_ATG05493 [Venturia nashicola]